MPVGHAPLVSGPGLVHFLGLFLLPVVPVSVLASSWLVDTKAELSQVPGVLCIAVLMDGLRVVRSPKKREGRGRGWGRGGDHLLTCRPASDRT